MPPAGVIVTAGGGNIANKSLVHTMLTDENDADIRNKMLYSLHKANQHITSIALQFPRIKVLETQIWDSAQIVADMLRTFVLNNAQNCNIISVYVVCNSVLAPDVLTTVFRTILTQNVDAQVGFVPDIESEPQNGTDTLVDEVTDSNQDQWHSINRVLKQCMYKNKRQFLVEWADGSTPSWLDRQRVSDDALSYFTQNRTRRRRKR